MTITSKGIQSEAQSTMLQWERGGMQQCPQLPLFMASDSILEYLCRAAGDAHVDRDQGGHGSKLGLRVSSRDTKGLPLATGPCSVSFTLHSDDKFTVNVNISFQGAWGRCGEWG